METQGRRAPRERRIRRAIVVLSSWQSALGAVIIAISFTVFACSSSERIRNACPYWAGFTVLFTGSVGFLTWKQLSIISIGIYTFLSAVSVIVHLVGTVLTGDCAGFLRSLRVCVEVKFEHACGCCVMNDTCKMPYKFPSVRDCSILNGLLKDLMYGLCAINVICCLICLGITVMGCTLVAQYSHYSQTFSLRWNRHSSQPSPDHGYNWLAFPSDPSDFIPPCAPPIYYPGQNSSGDIEHRNRRQPTVFDSVDFPPPYSSREPSLSGRQRTYFPDTGYSLVSSGQNSIDGGVELEAGYQGSEVQTEGRNGSEVDHEDCSASFGCIPEHGGSSVDLGSTSRVTISCDERPCRIPGAEGGESSIPTDNGDNTDMYHQVKNCSPPEAQVFVFESLSSMGTNTHQEGSGISQEGVPTNQPRRHSCPHNHHLNKSDKVYSPHDEVYQGIIAHNVNPWSRAISGQEAGTQSGSSSPRYLKRRANSIPNCSTLTYREPSIYIDCQTRVTRRETCNNEIVGASSADLPSSKRSCGTEELGDLFRNFKEKKAPQTVSKSRRRRRRRRPRNNPGHILEHDNGKAGSLRVSDPEIDCRETTL